jgi:hypothetical protein
MNIYEKMLAITKAVQNVEKKGENKFSNYKYVRAVDVIEAVQSELVKNGVCLTITETSFTSTHPEGDKNHYADLKCTATFTNVEKIDEKIIVDYFGRAADTLDKDIYKAKTNGLKYLLTQQFMIITDALTDAEQDNKYDTHSEPVKDTKGKKDISPVKATTTQAELIDALVKKTKDPSKTLDYILTKYNINTYNGLTSSQADEVILALNKKLEGK